MITIDALNYDRLSGLACLAQSPQLHKQMALCADMDRVFEISMCIMYQSGFLYLTHFSSFFFSSCFPR